MKVHYPKWYNMAHLLSLNVLLLPKDLTIIFYFFLEFTVYPLNILQLSFRHVEDVHEDLSW